MENSEVSQGINQCGPLNKMILYSMNVSLLSKYLNLALNLVPLHSAWGVI